MLRTTLDAERGPFFKVLETTPRSQSAVMTVPAGQEAGPPEVHPDSDQVFVVAGGRAEVKVWLPDGLVHDEVGPGAVFTVPAGARHWVRALGEDGGEPPYFFTVYAGPAYGPHRTSRTKVKANRAHDAPCAGCPSSSPPAS